MIRAAVAVGVALVLVAFNLSGCESCGPAQPPAKQTTASTETLVPGKLDPAAEPVKALPQDLSFDMDKVLLGRTLYHDTILSGDGKLACVTCHSFDHGGAEPRAVSNGIRGQQGPINSPTVLNSGLNFVQFWDGRAKDLAEQALGPVENPLEMGDQWTNVEKKVAAKAEYKAAFDKLYAGKISKDTITNAIAEYEKSLLTPSPFDDYLRGKSDAIGDLEKQGYAKFKETGCTTCHLGPNVGGGMFQKMGLVKDYFNERGGELTDADMGRFNVTKNEADRHFFKVPTLRNAELTPPYFHDGSQAKLEDAVKIMARVQLGKELSDDDVNAIVAFIKSLTGKLPAHTNPPDKNQNEPTDQAAGLSDPAKGSQAVASR